MSVSVKDLIRQRRSVRTFEAKALTAEDRKKLEAYLPTLTNPFGIAVSFRLLSAKEHGLSSPVIVGAEDYLAAKLARVENFEPACGYVFEKACLYACSLGIGSVMLAGTLNRAAFEKAMELDENACMPVASPLGYPAKKPSLRETLMRKGVKADERKSFESLFFEKSLQTPLTPQAAGAFADALEMVRLAPSSTNSQPWRLIVCGELVHFYEARSLKTNLLGDIQKLDLGIAMAHFDLALEEDGVFGEYRFENPNLPTPENYAYIATYRRLG